MTRPARTRGHRLRLIEGQAGEGQAGRGIAEPGSPEDAAAEAAAETPSPAPAAAGLTPGPVGESSAPAELLAELPDDKLVALALRADVGACEQLYRRHAGFAFNLAARIAGTTRDVEDVVHDAFLRAYDGLAELRNPKAFRSWLGSIVVHAMRSRLRRQRFMRLFGLGHSSDAIDLESIASPSAPAGARAELAQIYALLQTLPADVRIAWTLRFVEGHDLKTAAELTGCSLATIKRKIRKAQSYLELHFVDSSHRESLP